MDKLTRVDFMVNVNAIGTNSEILNKALNKLNELQENKKFVNENISINVICIFFILFVL